MTIQVFDTPWNIFSRREKLLIKKLSPSSNGQRNSSALSEEGLVHENPAWRTDTKNPSLAESREGNKDTILTIPKGFVFFFPY